MLAVWLLARKVDSRPGVTAGFFLILYGIFRFAVEFTRQPDPQLGFIAFGWLTMGQLLSVLLAVVGGVVFGVRWRSDGGDDKVTRSGQRTPPLSQAHYHSRDGKSRIAGKHSRP
jgi:prolipoprotein diacylglyceryltransferase